MDSHDQLQTAFDQDPETVARAVQAALADRATALELPPDLPEIGVGTERALSLVTPYVRAAGRDLSDPGFLAHMDPPTPWIAWVGTLLAASSNQNLLHPDTAPAARLLEQTVLGWLTPLFGMDGGHLVPGSTVANLTALWAARELTGADTVVASAHSHLSIRKAANILGLDYRPVDPSPADHRSLSASQLQQALEVGAGGPGLAPERTIVVLTAGTTGVGAIDQLDGPGPRQAAWLHVDAAWAGPLLFSDRHRHRLAGIEAADSVAVSAHKWLFQPKESAMVLFADTAAANPAISIDGAYLQVPNVGLLGSHGATAAPLAATLASLGRRGIAALVDRSMDQADRLLQRIEAEPGLEAFGPNRCGVVAWRHRRLAAGELVARLSDAFVSTVTIEDNAWLRSVAANPMADPDLVVDRVLAAARSLEN